MSRCMIKCALTLLMMSVLTGCWSKSELIEWGFVQAVAIDRNEDGLIQMTTHIYKPGNGTGDQSGKNALATSSFFNVITTGNSIFDAVRDISVKIGRKAQWSHMRVLLIGEETVKALKIGDVLDFFLRDHEPRDTVSILIAKGRADRILQQSPTIESTLGQQLLTIGEKGASTAGKTLKVTIGDLFIRSRSEVTLAVLPVITTPNPASASLGVQGLAIVDMHDGGQMAGTIPTRLVPYYLMLTNQYSGGVIEVPCRLNESDKSKPTDAFEVVGIESKNRLDIRGDSVQMKLDLVLQGAIAELVCGPVIEKEQWEQFDARLAAAVAKDIQETIELLQKMKTDVIGVGDRLYRSHTSLWKRWKPDWNERFADCKFKITVKSKVQNTGIDVGEPFTRDK